MIFPVKGMSYILWKSVSSSLKLARCSTKLSSISRTLTTSKMLSSNYEGDGKTTVTVLNSEYKHLIMIDSYSDCGFRLNNGIYTVGPLAAFPKTVLQWNVKNIQGLTLESLSLFYLLEPKLDILVIGTGDVRMLPSTHILEHLKSKKISTEILPTVQACSTFNFLNAEGRCIAGAFIPPSNVTLYEDELELMDEIHAIDDYGPSSSPYDIKRQKVRRD